MTGLNNTANAKRTGQIAKFFQFNAHKNQTLYRSVNECLVYLSMNVLRRKLPKGLPTDTVFSLLVETNLNIV